MEVLSVYSAYGWKYSKGGREFRARNIDRRVSCVSGGCRDESVKAINNCKWSEDTHLGLSNVPSWRENKM